MRIAVCDSMLGRYILEVYIFVFRLTSVRIVCSALIRKMSPRYKSVFGLTGQIIYAEIVDWLFGNMKKLRESGPWCCFVKGCYTTSNIKTSRNVIRFGYLEELDMHSSTIWSPVTL